MTRNDIPDGLKEIASEIPLVMKIIARTARWVHPEVFKALPVWRPDMARNEPLYHSNWTTRIKNKGVPKIEGNVAAQKSLMSALGVVGKKPSGWTTCHIWGYDDSRFVGQSKIVQDKRFYSCIGNMVLLPTPIKGFTDAVPEIKRHLRVCAFHLYGWACEHKDVASEAAIVRSGEIPSGYPKEWPTQRRSSLPPGTGPTNGIVRNRIMDRKKQIARLMQSMKYRKYPRDDVRKVIKFWKIDLAP